MVTLFIRHLYESSAPACSQYFFGLQLVQLAFALHFLVSSFTHSRTPSPPRISTFSLVIPAIDNKKIDNFENLLPSFIFTS